MEVHNNQAANKIMAVFPLSKYSRYSGYIPDKDTNINITKMLSSSKNTENHLFYSDKS